MPSWWRAALELLLPPACAGCGREVAELPFCPACAPQPAGAIVRFDGLSLHRAVAASEAGWRLWIRCVETDRQVQLDADIIECYGTVFRT